MIAQKPGSARAFRPFLAEVVKHRLLDDSPMLQVLDHDGVEKLRRNPRVPHTLRIHDNDGSSCTYAEAWRLTPLDPLWPEEESLALKQ